MINGIRASELRWLNKGDGSKFRVGSWVQQETPEEGRGRYRSNRCEYNKKDEDNSPKNLKYNFFKLFSFSSKEHIPNVFLLKSNLSILIFCSVDIFDWLHQNTVRLKIIIIIMIIIMHKRKTNVS